MSTNPPWIPSTSWPTGSALAIPDVEVCDVLALRAAGVLVYGPARGVVPVRDEFVFGELLDVDADDVEAIAEFEREYGRLGTRMPWTWDHETEHYPPFVGERPSSWLPGPFVGNEGWRRSRRALLHAEYPDLVSADLDDVNAAILEPWGEDTEVADWSMTARALRACALHLEAAGSIDPASAIPRAWREHGFEVKDADDAWRWFGIIVNERMQPFHLCVLVPGFMDEAQWFETARLENALALQIRNYVAEHASFHRCEYEPCGKVFAIDYGGRKRKRYCKDQHARLQGVRNSRRRKKERER